MFTHLIIIYISSGIIKVLYLRRILWVTYSFIFNMQYIHVILCVVQHLFKWVHHEFLSILCNPWQSCGVLVLRDKFPPTAAWSGVAEYQHNAYSISRFMMEEGAKGQLCWYRQILKKCKSVCFCLGSLASPTYEELLKNIRSQNEN